MLVSKGLVQTIIAKLVYPLLLYRLWDNPQYNRGTLFQPQQLFLADTFLFNLPTLFNIPTLLFNLPTSFQPPNSCF